MKRFADYKIYFFCILLILLNYKIVRSNQIPQREKLFKKADEIILSSKKEKVNFYSPERFANGMEYYNDAKNNYADSESISEIEQLLSNAITEFNKAIDHAKIASDFFSATMAAREDSLRVDGPTHDIEKWNEAEELFQEAVELFENEDNKYAKEKSVESEKRYREIELFAIQSKYLKETWLLLQKAENMNVEKYAPITLKKSRIFAEKSAAMLQANRYDQAEAAQIAEQAEYEVNHSIYLSKIIKNIINDDQTIETVFLALENSLQKIASIVNMNLYFDEGLEEPTKNVVQAIETLRQNNLYLSQKLEEEKKQYFQNLSQKDTEIYNSQNQILKLNEQLNQLSSTKNKLQSKVNQEQMRQKKLTRIGLLFNPSEAKILLEGDNIIIRLIGLSFPVGKAIIEPQYYNMLSRTIDAINEFSNCSVIVEGHTDSRGGDETNQKLSDERAKAVKEYIISNSAISDERIQYIGYGKTRPIATNETIEGQSMNRRIDLVIKPYNTKRSE